MLPHNSCIRYPALQILTKEIVNKEAAKFFGTTPSAISKCKQSDFTILETSFKQDKRCAPRIDVTVIITFWLITCEVPSGSKRTLLDRISEERVPVHVQRRTSWQLYLEFQTIHINFCCFSTFLLYKPFNVRLKRLPTKADLIDLCPHCLIINSLQLDCKQVVLCCPRRKTTRREGAKSYLTLKLRR